MKISRMNLTLGIVRSRSRSRHDFEICLHLPQYKLSSQVEYITPKKPKNSSNLDTSMKFGKKHPYMILFQNQS